MALRTLAVDFNCFFAACEAAEQPRLRGRPVGIVPVLADSSCIIAASYPARARRVRTGTGVAEAKRRCPDIQLVEARPRVYIDYHHRLLEVIGRCLPITAVRSIDEVECALTRTFAAPARALGVAREIKARVRREISPVLTSSIGIAPNWFLAKLASDMQKPDGLTVLDDADIPQRLLALPIDAFLGVGPRMGEHLRAAGIDTVARLYAASRARLRGIWGGVEGERIHGRLRGRDIPGPEPQRKSIGHSHVLPPALRSPARAHAVLHRLLQKAAMRLRHAGCYAAGLAAGISCRDGFRWSGELKLTETRDTLELTAALQQLLGQPGARHPGPVQVTVTLTRLRPPQGYTPELFDRPQREARERLCAAVDLVNRTFGHGSAYFGGAHGATANAPMRISFTCIPDPNIEEIDASCHRRLRPPPGAVPPALP